MDLSVVVPTLNGRDQLAACLDALAVHAPDAEVIVVNGPSADGTTGMVRERDDVDVLVEISDRTVNVARNAGIEVATGSVVAFVDYDNRIGASWVGALERGLERGDVVTGPIRMVPTSEGSDPTDSGDAADVADTTDATDAADAADTTDPAEAVDAADSGGSNGRDGRDGPERRRIAGREVTYFAGGNVAFRRDTLRDLDGFDEYLHTGGARDVAHRLASTDHAVVWEPELSVLEEPADCRAADGGRDSRDWGWKYRALAYRLLKNYGIRPGVLVRTGTHAVKDAVAVARDVVRGDTTPSGWAGNGRDVVFGIATGVSDGIVARTKDRSPARNPNGLSRRADRAVAKYDQRE
ncbi:glycosyltransferase [Halorubrum sp. JWXQ-INN 858]|uniref:glycosyltransferase family 2 protein n=1 Tax=Halorubrum sp. JWXQ-INN 858 TaxID=2690782 RepID=UPI001359ABB4|nr:glycosyltransferase [Halorubrum sp. JWXQ-INN 858]MWV63315.1 glycosyltransferase [Halorubrum sp. JWXQ-INN 858]